MENVTYVYRRVYYGGGELKDKRRYAYDVVPVGNLDAVGDLEKQVDHSNFSHLTSLIDVLRMKKPVMNVLNLPQEMIHGSSAEKESYLLSPLTKREFSALCKGLSK